jgi:hypothetical protein
MLNNGFALPLLGERAGVRADLKAIDLMAA